MSEEMKVPELPKFTMLQQKESESCANCYFSRAKSANMSDLDCRYDAPKQHMVMAQARGLPGLANSGGMSPMFFASFPTVQKNWWCGKWQPKQPQ